MPAIPVLELKTGAPRWYPAATGALFLTVIAALVVTPLRWPYFVGVLLSAMAVVYRAWKQEQGRARFSRLCIYSDFSIALVDREGSEIPAQASANCWVSTWLIVLPLALPTGEKMPVVVARSRNLAGAFRRFTVLCRFGFAVHETDRQNGRQSNIKGE